MNDFIKVSYPELLINHFLENLKYQESETFYKNFLTIGVRVGGVMY